MVTSNNSNQNPNNFMFGQNPKNNWHQIGRVVYTVIVAVAAFYYRLLQYVDTHPEVFKIWFGPDLHIVTSRLNDADIILTDYLEKSSSYPIWTSMFRERSGDITRYATDLQEIKND
jgi:hypothetical protein